MKIHNPTLPPRMLTYASSLEKDTVAHIIIITEDGKPASEFPWFVETTEKDERISPIGRLSFPIRQFIFHPRRDGGRRRAQRICILHRYFRFLDWILLAVLFIYICLVIITFGIDDELEPEKGPNQRTFSTRESQVQIIISYLSLLLRLDQIQRPMLRRRWRWV